MVDPHINKYAHLYEVILNINLIQSLDILKFYFLTLSELSKINTNCFLHIFFCFEYWFASFAQKMKNDNWIPINN